MSPLSNEPNPSSAEPEPLSYPLVKRTDELLFGDIIELPPDSGQDSGSALVLEGWQQDAENVHARGILLQDRPVIGGTHTFKLPSSVTVTGQKTFDELVGYYLNEDMIASMGKDKIESILRGMQSDFKPFRNNQGY